MATKLLGRSMDCRSAFLLFGWTLGLAALTGIAFPLGASSPSVVIVKGHQPGQLAHQGSGVVLAPGLVATNAHIIHGASSITLSWNGQTFPVQACQTAVQWDLALLTAPGLPIPPAAQASPERLKKGLAVQAIGYPGGKGPTITRGTLQNLWKVDHGLIIQSDAQTQPGSSGGGLFTEDGELLGITTFVFLFNGSLNFSIPLSFIHELQERGGDRGVCAPLNREAMVQGFLEHMTEQKDNLSAWQSLTGTWVQAAPEDPEGWFAYGLALLRGILSTPEGIPPDMKSLEKSLEACQKATQLRSDHAKSWNNLGATLGLLNRFDEALDALRKAVRLDPNYALAWFNLGGTYLSAGRPDQGVEAFERGLKMQPDEDRNWMRLALCEQKMGRSSQAFDHYRISLRLAPLHPDRWMEAYVLGLTIGRVEELQGDLERIRPILGPTYDEIQKGWGTLRKQRQALPKKS